VREARHWADQALEQLRPDSPARLPTLELAGRLAAMEGDADRAEALTCQALAIARARREDVTAGRLLITLGDVALERGAFRDARRMYEDALTLVEASADDRAISLAVAGLGQVAEAEGDLDRAAALIDSAVSRSQARNLMNLPPLLGLVGSLGLRQGNGARAEEAFRSALELAVERRQALTAEDALAGIAAARALQGDIAGAARACAAVDALNQEPGASKALAEFADYLDVVGFAPEADRPQMTLEEAVVYALADD
jgi:tetratricopeptide (TPR) repeat protein